MTEVFERRRILIVDDEERMVRFIRMNLEHDGFQVSEAFNGKQAISNIRDVNPDLILLDVMMPDLDGFEVLETVREISNVPVIMLTAKGEEDDRVHGLELGADDYVTKPFSPRELMARVQAAIRRRKRTAQSAIYRFGECEIDFEKMTAKRAATPVVLTSHEFKLLRFFTDNPERVLSREVLLNEVWGYNSYPTTRTVDNQILKLRQKLEPDPANPKHLLTIYGAGYKFVP